MIKKRVTDDFYKKMIKLALPIAFQQLIISVLNLVDIFMISSLSEEAIAGVGAANKLYFLFNLFLFGMSSGSAILTAQYWGVKDIKTIRKVYGISLTLGIVGSFLFGSLAIFVPEWVMGFFTKDQAVIQQGVIYLQTIGISYLFTAVSFATVFILRSTNYVKLPMIISIIAIGLNTFLNWVLIFGNLGFEALGVKGAALATVIARGVEVVLVIGLTYHFHLPPAGQLREIFGYNYHLVKRFFVIAGPVIINELLWSSGVTMYAAVYGRMGTTVMASMTINQTIEQIFFVFIMGISSGAAIILGNELGRGELELAYKDSLRSMKLSLLIAIGLSLILVFTAKPIAYLFNVSIEIQANIIACLYVFAAYMPIRMLNTLIVVGILRSGGDTVFTAVIDGLGVWLVGVPLAFLTGLAWGWPIWWVYAAIMIEEAVKFIFGFWRTLSKKWLKNLVEDN